MSRSGLVGARIVFQLVEGMQELIDGDEDFGDEVVVGIGLGALGKPGIALEGSSERLGGT